MASPAQAIVGYYVLPQQTLKPAILARMAFHGRYGAIRREKIAPVGLSGSSSISGAGAGDGGGAGETHGGYFFPPNCPVTPVEGHTSQDGGLEGLLGENIISHDGLGGGGHKVPRVRGYSSKPNSPLSRRLACRLGRGRP